MGMKFQDNRIQVKAALDDAVYQFLEDAASTIQAAAQRNTPAGKTGQLKGSWDHIVDESAKEATVGNPSEYAIWQEMGTGEYALKGNGRKGYWVYVEGGTKRSRKSKKYTLEEAQKAVAYLRSKGLDAYYTNGSKPVRMLHRAFESNKNKIIRRAETILKERMGK